MTAPGSPGSRDDAPALRRAARWLVVAALSLLVATAGLSGTLYLAARRAVEELLAQRLAAIGATAHGLLDRGRDMSRPLAELVASNQLDGAVVFDGELAIQVGAQARPDRRIPLLELAPREARAAVAGRPATGWYRTAAGGRVFGGFFPVPGVPPLGLAIQAGPAFAAPALQLEAAALGALLAGGGLLALALIALALAARSARAERTAFVRAEGGQLMARMAAMVAHEVRNPLGIIRGGAELLRERTAAPGDRELLDDILGEVARINALTEEFLALAREAPLKLEPVALGPLAREVLDGVARRYRDEGLATTVAGDAEVRADRDRLRQALLNLAVNAAQATEGRGRVRVEIAPGPRGVTIAVSDDGPGIPAEVRAELFQPFASFKPKGTGLGLAISRAVVERHGGRLRLADAVPGQGARFELTLPG